MAKSNIVKFNMDKYLQKQIIEERREQIYNVIMLRRRIKEINKALTALRKSGYYDESIAVENLTSQVTSQAVGLRTTRTGNISVVGLKVGKISSGQLTSITKSITDFLKNKTSTIAGMEELYEERRSELATMFKDREFVDSLSYKDLRNIYSVFQSDLYDKENKRYDSKSFFTVYIQAIDEKKDKQWFLKTMENYQNYGNDKELRQASSDIYDKYIKFYAKR